MTISELINYISDSGHVSGYSLMSRFDESKAGDSQRLVSVSRTGGGAIDEEVDRPDFVIVLAGLPIDTESEQLLIEQTSNSLRNYMNTQTCSGNAFFFQLLAGINGPYTTKSNRPVFEFNVRALTSLNN